MKIAMRAAAFVLPAIALLAGCAQTGGLNVKEVGSYHIGGEQVTLKGLPSKQIVYSPGSPPVTLNPNGDFVAGQMYTRYTILENPSASVPMLMWHGGGLSGTTYETKPDGNPGWEMDFLHDGWNVYVSDAVERGRASWARYPNIFQGEPVFRTKKEAWELFRIGKTYAADPQARTAIPGTLFPIASFEQFTKQSIPRWATNDERTQRAYDQYVQQACPCVIVVHSQGGNFALTSALKYPDKVKAVVLVEPSGSPDPDKTDLTPLQHVPMLWVWGDFIQHYPFWQNIKQRQERFRAALNQAGGHGDLLDLPAQGIHGNSHMVMMDTNSQRVSGLIQDWLKKQGLVR